ncbi:hypothetical protein TSOC_014412, partial [Tetrabaena socialis]
AAPPLHLACLVRDFDVGSLAGQLQDFRVLAASPSLLQAEYVSVLPWPFEPRWLSVTMRIGVVRGTGAVVLLGESVRGAAPPPGRAVTPGTVHYSYYHIAPAAPARANGRASGAGGVRSVMRRAINIDMRIPLPAFVVRKSLASHYAADMAAVEREVAGWEGGALQRRLREGECYRVLERAVEAAAGR